MASNVVSPELVRNPYKFKFGDGQCRQSNASRPRLRTVKHCLTIELVSNAYQFKSGQPTSDFDQAVEHIKKLETPKPKRARRGEKE